MVFQNFAENIGFFGYHKQKNIMGVKITSNPTIEFSSLKRVKVDRLGIIVE